jgi:hypothetical protein
VYLMKVSHWLLIVCMATSVNGLAADSQTEDASASKSEPGLYLKVQLEQNLKTSGLKPGDIVNGKLTQAVYSADREVFASGSQVQMTVDHLERRRKEPNDHWPWAIRVFLPRHENYPTFHASNVLSSDGAQTFLQISFAAIQREHVAQAPEKIKHIGTARSSLGSSTERSQESSTGKSSVERIATLFATLPANEAPSTPAFSSSGVLASGTHAKVILLGAVSAGKSRAGDKIQARIVEPVRTDSAVVLPEGTLLEGEIVKSTPPRRLSRGGALYLKFNRLVIPGGPKTAVAASLTGIEINERSHTKIDAEGGLRANHPGKAWLLANIGVTAGLAKVADDTTQLIIEAVISTATDASTAGSAKIAAACVSGVFMLTRHGRDVVIPQFTQMDIMFDRPVLLPASEKSEQGAAALPSGDRNTRAYAGDLLNIR